MRPEILRWPVLAAAAVLGARALLRGGARPLAEAAACAALWWLLSRRKARSLDAAVGRREGPPEA